MRNHRMNGQLLTRRDDTRRGEIPHLPTSGLKLWLRSGFFNTTTSWEDKIGNGNDATLLDGVSAGALWQSGARRWHVNFDGSNDYAMLSNAASLNPTSALTLAIFFKVNAATGAYRDVFSRWITVDVAHRAYVINVNNLERVEFVTSRLGTAATVVTVTDPSTLPVGAWTFFVGTWDGATMRLYRDGLEVANGAQTGMATTTSRTSIGATASRAGDSVGGFASCSVSDALLYDRALSAGEVMRLYRLMSQR